MQPWTIFFGIVSNRCIAAFNINWSKRQFSLGGCPSVIYPSMLFRS